MLVRRRGGGCEDVVNVLGVAVAVGGVVYVMGVVRQSH